MSRELFLIRTVAGWHLSLLKGRRINYKVFDPLYAVYASSRWVLVRWQLLHMLLLTGLTYPPFTPLAFIACLRNVMIYLGIDSGVGFRCLLQGNLLRHLELTRWQFSRPLIGLTVYFCIKPKVCNAHWISQSVQKQWFAKLPCLYLI